MKKYKLLKDTPTIKAGTVFEEVVGDFDGLKALTRITPVGAKTSPQFTIKDIDNFDEWFEEISEYKRWRAAYGGTYAYISDDGSLSFDTENGDNIDRYRHNTGNYVKTDELELLSRKQEYLRAHQVLLDDAKGGRWAKGGYNLYVFHNGIDFNIAETINYRPGTVYFQSKEALNKSLEEHKKQWEIVRKYEAGE